MLNRPAGFYRDFHPGKLLCLYITSNMSISYYVCVPIRSLKLIKILQQKGQTKKNSDLQKILANLSDELEVSKINKWIYKVKCCYRNQRDEKSVYFVSRTNVIVPYSLVAIRICVRVVPTNWMEHVTFVERK